MKNFLKRLYQRYPNNILLRGLRACKNFAKTFIPGTAAVFRLLRWKFQKRKTLPVRVCFIQQDPNCWNKSRALYDLLQKDPRFEVSLLCIPDPFDPDTESTIRFYREQGYDAIDARIGNGPWDARSGQGEWFDIRALKPDYVFYQQPYNHYLPVQYQSGSVSKYAKICLTPYGFTLTKNFLNIVPKGFFRDLYRLYAMTEEEKTANTNRFPISHKLNIRKTQYFSPLVFSDFFRNREEESPSWNFSKNTFRVIWTPRWTTDKVNGGSNFFQYKDFLPAYADQNPDVDILFRPHPMAFDNFVCTGEMTQSEVDAYIAGCERRKNTALDKEKRYDATFWGSSVLLTDISSIIGEYFVTGKPIIFCPTKNRTDGYLDFFDQILSVCYIAHNSADIEKYLQQLKSGIDPLKKLRQELIGQLFGEDLTQAPQRIQQDLLDDFIK